MYEDVDPAEYFKSALRQRSCSASCGDVGDDNLLGRQVACAAGGDDNVCSGGP